MTWTKHVRIVNTLKGENFVIFIQTHAFACFSFGTSILLYALRSTIFTLVQLSPIYSIFIESISENHLCYSFLT